VNLKDNGNVLDGGAFTLNSSGYTEDQAIQLVGGSHSLSAAYSGDNSFNGSSSSIYTLTVTPAPTVTTIDTIDNSPTGSTGTPFGLNVLVQTHSSGAIPSGTYSLYDGGVALAATSQVSGGQDGVFDPGHAFVQGGVTTTFAAAGRHSLTVKYSGDANYAPSTSVTPYAVTITNGTQTTLAASATNIIAGNSITLTAVVDSQVKIPSLSKSVIFYGTGDGYFSAPIAYANITDAQGNAALQASMTVTPFQTEQIWANFNGDSNFTQSSSYLSPLSITVVTPDFSATIDSPTINVVAGQSAAGKIAVTPATNLTSNVTFTCNQSLPSGVTCSVTPNPLTISNGQASTATVTYSCPAPSASLTTSYVLPPGPIGGLPSRGLCSASALAACLAFFLLLLPDRAKWRRPTIAAVTMSIFLLAIGCGGGGGSVSVGGGGGGGSTPTSISLTANAGKLPYPSSLTLTAKVTGSHPLTGTVTFTDVTAGGGLGNNTLVNGTATVQFPPFYGAHTYTASYSGDSTNLASQTSGSVTIVVTGSFPSQIGAATGNDFKGIPINLIIQ
jgi:hypothetical protein